MNLQPITDKEKQIAHWLFDLTIGVPHSGASFFGHLYNTFFLLKQMGVRESTCIAGMCHALYGTEFFRFRSVMEREQLQSIIGKDAEVLVYLFSLPKRDQRIIKNTENLDEDTALQLLQILYANGYEQSNKIKYETQIHWEAAKMHHYKLEKIIIEKGGRILE